MTQCNRASCLMSGPSPNRILDLQVVQLVQRMAEQLQSNKLQVVFLINNYHEVMLPKNSSCLVVASEHVVGLREEQQQLNICVSFTFFRDCFPCELLCGILPRQTRQYMCACCLITRATFCTQISCSVVVVYGLYMWSAVTPFLEESY